MAITFSFECEDGDPSVEIIDENGTTIYAFDAGCMGWDEANRTIGKLARNEHPGATVVVTEYYAECAKGEPHAEEIKDALIAG